MVSNDCKEKCRDFGMLVENIICMADCYEEPIEKFRKSMFYKSSECGGKTVYL